MRDSLQNEKKIWFVLYVHGKLFFKWMKAFKDGRKSITNNSRNGRSVDVSTSESVQAVEDMIRLDRRISFDEIATNCTNQQPPHRDGAVPGPVWVGSKWLLAFPRVPATPGTPLHFFAMLLPERPQKDSTQLL